MCCAGVLIFAAFLFRHCLLVLYKYVLIAAVFANVVVKTVFELQQIIISYIRCFVCCKQIRVSPKISCRAKPYVL